jgi:hypothetical protein
VQYFLLTLRRPATSIRHKKPDEVSEERPGFLPPLIGLGDKAFLLSRGKKSSGIAMHGTRRVLLACLLISLTVMFGYVLAGIPNVELMTITIFLSGYLLGIRLGFIIGAASSLIHALFNPLGASLPPLLVAQCAGFSLIGVSGALFGPFIHTLRNRWSAVLIAGLVGLSLTLLYDVLTNIAAYYIAMGAGPASGLMGFVFGGILFMGMHIIWNTGLFLFVLKPVITVLSRYRYEIS